LNKAIYSNIIEAEILKCCNVEYDVHKVIENKR
jgi:hypothetical protein